MSAATSCVANTAKRGEDIAPPVPWRGICGAGESSAPCGLFRTDRLFEVRPPTLIGLPYDASSSFLRGTALAPPGIRAALWSPAGNPFSEALIDLSAPGAVADAGDLELGEGDDARARITDGIDRLIAEGGRPIALGGDHSVTYPIVRAVRRSAPRLTRSSPRFAPASPAWAGSPTRCRSSWARV